MAVDVFNARLEAQTDLIREPKFDFRLKGIRGKSHFEEEGTQNYLVFQPIYRYFRRIIGTGSGNYIYFWKSIGLSDERLNFNTASN